MTTRLYYFLSSLPPLPPLGRTPPITMQEVLERMRREANEKVRFLAEALDSEAKLIQTAHMRLLNPTPGDTVGALSIDPKAPPLIVGLLVEDPDEVGEDKWLTRLWSAHLDFLEGVGKTVNSPLLCLWAGWERSLCLQLARVRRASVSVPQNPGPRVIDWDHTPLVEQWRTASDPMAGEWILDQARMDFIHTHTPHYSFTVDELAAYWLKLGVLTRHARLSREAGWKVLKEVSTL